MKRAILFFILIAPAFAAIALVNTAAPCRGTSGCTTTAVDMTGATLMVCMQGGAATSPNITSSPSNTWTQVTLASVSGEAITASYVNSATPTVNSTMTFSSSTSGSIGCYGFSGTAATPKDKSNGLASSSFGSSAQPGSTGTLTQAAEVVITAIQTAGSQAGTPSVSAGYSGVSFVNTTGAAHSLGVAYQVVGATTALNPTWTFSGTGYGVGIVTFQAASGSAFTASTTETSLAGDSAARLASLVRAPVETDLGRHSHVGLAQHFGIVWELIIVNSQAPATLGSHFALVRESVLAGTQSQALSAHFAVPVDSISGRDITVGIGAHFASPSDTFAIAESQARVFGMVRAAIEAVMIAESRTQQAAHFAITSDIGYGRELLASTAGHFANVSDRFSLSDLQSRGFGVGRNVQESLIIAESRSQQSAHFAGVSDRVSLSDVSVRVAAHFMATIDALPLTIAASSSAAHFARSTEATFIMDSAFGITGGGGPQHWFVSVSETIVGRQVVLAVRMPWNPIVAPLHAAIYRAPAAAGEYLAPVASAIHQSPIVTAIDSYLDKVLSGLYPMKQTNVVVNLQ